VGVVDDPVIIAMFVMHQLITMDQKFESTAAFVSIMDILKIIVHKDSVFFFNLPKWENEDHVSFFDVNQFN